MMHSLKKTKTKLAARSDRGVPYRSHIEVNNNNWYNHNNNNNAESLSNYNNNNNNNNNNSIDNNNDSNNNINPIHTLYHYLP